MNWTQTNETNECVYFTCGNRRKKKCNSTRIVYKNPYNVIETSHSTSCIYEQNKLKFPNTSNESNFENKNETMKIKSKIKISLDYIPKTSKTTFSNDFKDNFNESDSVNQAFQSEGISTNDKFISQNSIEMKKSIIKYLKNSKTIYEEYDNF